MMLSFNNWSFLIPIVGIISFLIKQQMREKVGEMLSIFLKLFCQNIGQNFNINFFVCSSVTRLGAPVCYVQSLVQHKKFYFSRALSIKFFVFSVCF